MKLTFDDRDQLTIVRISGEVTGDDAERLRHEATQRMERKVRDFVLDLEETEFIDSKGLEALLWLQDEAVERLGQTRLAACPHNIDTILDITRLGSRFDRHRDVEGAIGSLS